MVGLTPNGPSVPLGKRPEFVIDLSCDGAAATILNEADYCTFGTIRTSENKFALGKGSNLLTLSEDFQVYDPCGRLDDDDEHLVVAHFAMRLKDIDKQFDDLAAARDHASTSYDGPVVACAFLCQEIIEMREPRVVSSSGDDEIPTIVKERANDTGVVVFFGTDLGDTIAATIFRATAVTVIADLIILRIKLKAAKAALASGAGGGETPEIDERQVRRLADIIVTKLVRLVDEDDDEKVQRLLDSLDSPL